MLKMESNDYTFMDNALASAIQMQIMRHLNTGDPIRDAILAQLIMSILNPKLINPIIQSFGKLSYSVIAYIYEYIYNKLYPPKQKKPGIIYVKKEAEVKYITENKKINELYKAVLWYLSNSPNIDYKHVSPIFFSYDHIISPGMELIDTNIRKSISNNIKKDIYHNGHRIDYEHSKELINIYTDKERKRENYSIKLTTLLDSHANQDVLEEFCKFCLTSYADSLNKKTWEQQYYINKNSSWIGQKSNNGRTLETVILRQGLMNSIKSDIQLFLNSEDWYKQRDQPYTRGYLFYGLPGTGKTSMIKALSLSTRRHIHQLVLSNVRSNDELDKLLSAVPYDETILVIDDIDCAGDVVMDRDLKKRELEEMNEEDETDKPQYKMSELNNKKTASKTKLTLDGLLTALSGIVTYHGRILIATTNHPEMLDKALLRPGRIDNKFFFDNCDREQIRGLFEMFFNITCTYDLLDCVRVDKTYSPAHVVSVFMRFRDKPHEALYHLDDLDAEFEEYLEKVES